MSESQLDCLDDNTFSLSGDSAGNDDPAADLETAMAVEGADQLGSAPTHAENGEANPLQDNQSALGDVVMLDKPVVPDANQGAQDGGGGGVGPLVDGAREGSAGLRKGPVRITRLKKGVAKGGKGGRLCKTSAAGAEHPDSRKPSYTKLNLQKFGRNAKRKTVQESKCEVAKRAIRAKRLVWMKVSTTKWRASLEKGKKRGYSAGKLVSRLARGAADGVADDTLNPSSKLGHTKVEVLRTCKTHAKRNQASSSARTTKRSSTRQTAVVKRVVLQKGPISKRLERDKAQKRAAKKADLVDDENIPLILPLRSRGSHAGELQAEREEPISPDKQATINAMDRTLEGGSLNSDNRVELAERDLAGGTRTSSGQDQAGFKALKSKQGGPGGVRASVPEPR
jgi:hypothetical protein